MNFNRTSPLSLGPYFHTKACYLCQQEAPNPVIASSTCSFCGESTVVYALGRRVTTVEKVSGWRRFFTRPTVSTVFMIQYADNIDWQRHIGLPMREYVQPTMPDQNPHLMSAASIQSDQEEVANIDTGKAVDLVAKFQQVYDISDRLRLNLLIRCNPMVSTRKSWYVTIDNVAPLSFCGRGRSTLTEALDDFIEAFKNIYPAMESQA